MPGKVFTDQLHRQIEISYPPQKIISLVPSQTELLFDLGLDAEIIGITKFCIHPAEKARSKKKIGGTKKLNVQAIRNLQPDLIIANKEENDKEQVELLMSEFPVWISDIYTLNDSLNMIEQVGMLCNKAEKAADISKAIRNGFNSIPVVAARSLSIAYFIWKDPYMVAGTDTFIDHMIQLAGWKNAFSTSRYPVVSASQIRELSPDVIFLSSEPYPFKEKHSEEFKRICPDAIVKIVDGELFSWYGSRLVQTPAYLNLLIQQLV